MHFDEIPVCGKTHAVSGSVQKFGA